VREDDLKKHPAEETTSLASQSKGLRPFIFQLTYHFHKRMAIEFLRYSMMREVDRKKFLVRLSREFQ
jgi:hypothetical protein